MGFFILFFRYPEFCKYLILKKFFRSPDPRVKNIEGSGLGLFLVRHALGAHGGHLKVKSTPEKGSTFKVYFPIMKRNTTGKEVKI